MWVFGIVHLVYEEPRDLPELCTQLVWLLWFTGPGDVQSRTACI